MTDTTEIVRGRWYPDVPPALPDETDDSYTNRLTGADRADRRPFDHPRNRQCSIGYHGECSDPTGDVCKCPHHTDVAPSPELVTPAVERCAAILAELYYLPVQTTATRVMAEATRSIEAGEVTTLGGLRAMLGGLYDSTIEEGFAIDVANILGHLKKLGG